jgi:hypothetical protein
MSGFFMAEPANRAVLEFLQQRGYTEIEIAKILDYLARHDQETVTDVVFDSIGRGSTTLDDMIRQALAKE